MKINISMVINNFEWIVNNQIAMDIIKLLGFQTQLNEAFRDIRKIAKIDKYKNIIVNEDITMEYIEIHKNKDDNRIGFILILTSSHVIY